MNSSNEYFTKQMSLLAKEQVLAYIVHNRDLYIFGSEEACQRINLYFEGREVEVNLYYAIDPWYQYYITMHDFINSVVSS